MKRGARANLILLAGVVALAAATVAELRRERTLGVDPLTALDADTVRTLAVDCAGCVPRRFEKHGQHWRMLEPYAQAADDAAVARLLAIARAPVRFRRARDGLDPRKLGLDPPQASLRLDDTLLKFGATDQINGDRYADAGGTIALVPDRFSALLFARAESELAKPPASNGN